MANEAAERTVREIIALLDEILAVIAGENERMSTGLPASLAQSVARKTQLSAQFEALMLSMQRGEFEVQAASPQSFARLLERLKDIRPLLDENTDLIRTSMHATRRRIEAIMAALRAQSAAPRGYGADRRLLHRAQSHGSQVA